jgi:hypothetical protein
MDGKSTGALRRLIVELVDEFNCYYLPVYIFLDEDSGRIHRGN